MKVDEAPTRRNAEERIATLAARQHGVVTRGQLLAAGLTPRTVDRRVARGLLRRLQRGVYQVGPVAGSRARELAALLACGRGARVSHRSAGWLWEITPDPGSGAPVEVTVPGGRVVRRPGIRTYRALDVDAEEAASVDGVLVTPPTRTLLDLAAAAGARDLEDRSSPPFPGMGSPHRPSMPASDLMRWTATGRPRPSPSSSTAPPTTAPGRARSTIATATPTSPPAASG